MSNQLLSLNFKRTKLLYNTEPLDSTDDQSQKLRVLAKLKAEYNFNPDDTLSLVKKSDLSMPSTHSSKIPDHKTTVQKLLDNLDLSKEIAKTEESLNVDPKESSNSIRSLIRRKTIQQIQPAYHPQWRLMRVISGHLGWVRSLSVEPGNQWFASGSGDRTIKIWDLASGTLKVSLTGHISSVRGLAVSHRHPYLFSCGEDKQIKCWDLECNKVIRHYHGHLSGIYCMALHPKLDLLVTGARDATARVWDMRSKACVRILSGHKSTVSSIACQEFEPQITTGSMDTTVRLFDLVAGKTRSVLTHHKKGIRSVTLHPSEFAFVSGAPDNIKHFNYPNGTFIKNFPHNAMVNTLSINQDNVVFSAADNGSMCFWDWKSGHKFQEFTSIPQPGSLDSEAGVFCSTFDQTGLRLITGEADKTIKIYKEVE